MEATVRLQLVVIVVLGALNLCAAENLVPGGDFTEAKKGKIDWCRREGGATGAFVLAVALVPGVREMKPVEGMYSLRAAMPCPWYDWTDYDTVGQCLAKANCVETRDASLPPEGYSLKVAPGRIEIASSDEAGAFYARETLKQLTAKVSTDSVEIACCEIRDWPRYRWRGLLIDEARHFLGKNVVMRVLDQMAQHKLNVLHWHLVDDQGWRLEIKSHPELVKYGSVRPRSVKMGTHARWLPPDKKLSFEYDTETYGPYFYSHDDVREILAYARVRHITVVPEIELPGHVRALLAAHPELSCRGDLERIPRVAWSIEKDVLCVGNDAAIRLLEEVFDEVCELFPDTPLHPHRRRRVPARPMEGMSKVPGPDEGFGAEGRERPAVVDHVAFRWIHREEGASCRRLGRGPRGRRPDVDRWHDLANVGQGRRHDALCLRSRGGGPRA